MGVPARRANGPARSGWRELARIGGVATLLALYVRTFLWLPLHVSSESMVPTLLPGDHVMVDRLASVHAAGVLPGGGPRRGDVLVLRAPEGPDHLVVKRCVALPGEEIERRSGQLLVNGRAIDAEWATRPGADFSPVRVGPGQIFVLGDQPSRSVDSRTWGPVDADSYMGRAVVVYWSTSSRERVGWDRLARSLATRLTATRWDRVLRPVR